MRDYLYAENVPVSEMLTSEIQACLNDGVESFVDTVSAEAIVARLELELFIRARGLRSSRNNC